MTTQMTQRDKKLLYIVVLIAVVFLVAYFVLIPLNKKNIQLEEELDSLRTSKAETEMRIASLPSLRKNLEQTSERYDELSDGFYPMMESQEIDRVMTSLALDFGLFTERLAISIPSGYSSVEPYVNSALAEEWKHSEPLDGFYSVNLSFDLIGSPERLQSFLDYLGQQKTIRVVSAAWLYREADASRDYVINMGVDTASTLNLELDFYMYEKYEVKEID